MIKLTAIIVTVKKDKHLLKTCLVSLDKSVKHAGADINYLIVANGTVIRKEEYPATGVSILKLKKNAGFGPAVNSAMKKVESDWVIIVCPDVITGKSCLNEILPFSLDTTAGIIAPLVRLKDKRIQKTILPVPSIKEIFIESSYLYRLLPALFKSPLSDNSFYKRTGKVGAVAAIWWLVRKEAFQKAGGFDNRFFLYFEDVDLCCRMRKSGYDLIFAHRAEALHLPHQSTGGKTDGRLYLISLKRFLRKYYGKNTSAFAIIIFAIGSYLRFFYWLFIYLTGRNLNTRKTAVDKLFFFISMAS